MKSGDLLEWIRRNGDLNLFVLIMYSIVDSIINAFSLLVGSFNLYGINSTIVASFWFNKEKQKINCGLTQNKIVQPSPIQGMSNIYLKVTIERKRRFQNLALKSLKSSSPGQFLGSSNSCRYKWSFKSLVATKKSETWEQNCVWLFYYFIFERNYVKRIISRETDYI